MKQNPSKLCFTIKQAADSCGLSSRTVRRMIDDGALASCLLGGRRLVVAASLIQAVERGTALAVNGETLRSKKAVR